VVKLGPLATDSGTWAGLARPGIDQASFLKPAAGQTVAFGCNYAHRFGIWRDKHHDNR